MNKTFVASSAAVLLALASPISASAAVGTLPDGDRLFTLECSNSGDGVNDSQLYQIDPVTGGMTAVGTGQSTDTGWCSSNVAYDPTTGTYWTFDWSDVDPDTGGTQYGLLTIDIETGEITTGAATFSDGDPTWSDNYSIAINSDGEAFAVGINQLYTLDLQTGEAVAIWETNLGSISGAGSQPYGAAFNPADGLLYVQYDDSRKLYVLDVEAETYELVTQFPAGVDWYGPLGFDSDGNVWQQNNRDFFTYSLDDVESLSERTPMMLGEEQPWTESFFVARGGTVAAETLADTGFNSATWLAITALMLASGVAAIRRRATN